MQMTMLEFQIAQATAGETHTPAAEAERLARRAWLQARADARADRKGRRRHEGRRVRHLPRATAVGAPAAR
jgi:uncharacterized protein YfaQ (DUF2300 family)